VGLADVGMIALVDDVTRFQGIRARNVLAKTLESFIDNELQPWTKTFPKSFYVFNERGQKMDFKDWIDICSIIVQAILAAATVWLGWRVYKWTQITEKTGQINAMLGSLNHLNEMALSSDDNLKAIDGLYVDGRDKSIDAARSRWATFLALQTHHQYYFANKLGLLPGDIACQMDDEVLDLLLSNDEVVSLVENRGFDTEFVNYCKGRAAKQAREKR